nr:glycosyltransferase family 4 protein [Sanguibacter suarezii]
MKPAPLRILIIGLNYRPEPSGSAPYTAGLAEGLSQRGHEVRVLAGLPHYPQWKLVEGYRGRRRSEVIDGVHVTRFRHPIPASPTLASRVAMEVIFGVQAGLKGWKGADVVIATSPALISSSIASGFFRFKYRRPVIGFWIQDIYSKGAQETGQLNGRFAGILAKFESRTLRLANGVVVIHELFRSQLVDVMGVKQSSVRVIRNWSHLEDHAPVNRVATRARYGWSDSDVVVLHTGNMGVKQGLGNVVEAAKLAQSRSSRVKFVLLGNGNQRPALERSASGLEKISFIDSVGDREYQDMMRAADVLLVNELVGVAEMSVPSKLTSYFTTGVPVLAATAPGGATASEIAASGGGIRVEAGDPLALLIAAEDLGRTPLLASALGESGRRFREEVLTERAALDQFEDWLYSLTAESRSSRPLDKVSS